MADSDIELFRRAIQGVTKLSVEPRVHVHRPRSAPPFRHVQQAALPPVSVPALSDDFEPVDLEQADGGMFHPPHPGRNVMRKLQRGAWPVEAQLDLHYMRRSEAREALCHFLHQAVQRGLRCICVIHGQGWGSPNSQPVLKAKVRIWLSQMENVIAFCSAHPRQGGEGAVMVLLRSSLAFRRNAR